MNLSMKFRMHVCARDERRGSARTVSTFKAPVLLHAVVPDHQIGVQKVGSLRRHQMIRRSPPWSTHDAYAVAFPKPVGRFGAKAAIDVMGLLIRESSVQVSNSCCRFSEFKYTERNISSSVRPTSFGQGRLPHAPWLHTLKSAVRQTCQCAAEPRHGAFLHIRTTRRPPLRPEATLFLRPHDSESFGQHPDIPGAWARMAHATLLAVKLLVRGSYAFGHSFLIPGCEPLNRFDPWERFVPLATLVAATGSAMSRRKLFALGPEPAREPVP